MSELVIFEEGVEQVEVRLEGETLWITQAQMAELFEVQKAAVSKHLKNIYASGELERAATVSKMETVRKEGNRAVTRHIEYYNLVNKKADEVFRHIFRAYPELSSPYYASATI